MNFDLDEGQLMVRESVARFLGPVDIAARRAMRQADGGYPRERWRELADLGLLALAAPEAMGGLGGTIVDLALVAEALGKGLAIDPWLENGLLPIRVAAAVGDATLVSELLGGKRIAALAFAEPGRRYETDAAATNADGGAVRGAKTFVLGGGLANTLLVTLAGERIAKVAREGDGVVLRAHPVIDGSQAATLDLHDAPAETFVLPSAGFERVIAEVRLLAAAEMLGLAQTMFDETLAYARQREQFGAPIGSFQAIQHRLVECYAALEQARSMVLRTALLEASADAGQWPRLAAGAKAYVGEAAIRIGHEAVQIHGGMGQTDELAIGHALKRVLLLDKLFGDQAHCLRLRERGMSALAPIAPGLWTDEPEPRLIGGRRGDGTIVFPMPEGDVAGLVEPVALSRRGTLWSWTTQDFEPKEPYAGPKPFEPYLIGYVELPGEVIIETRIVDASPADLTIGMPMELMIVPFDDRRATYAFRPEGDR